MAKSEQELASQKHRKHLKNVVVNRYRDLSEFMDRPFTKQNLTNLRGAADSFAAAVKELEEELWTDSAS